MKIGPVTSAYLEDADGKRIDLPLADLYIEMVQAQALTFDDPTVKLIPKDTGFTGFTIPIRPYIPRYPPPAPPLSVFAAPAPIWPSDWTVKGERKQGRSKVQDIDLKLQSKLGLGEDKTVMHVLEVSIGTPRFDPARDKARRRRIHSMRRIQRKKHGRR